VTRAARGAGVAIVLLAGGCYEKVCEDPPPIQIFGLPRTGALVFDLSLDDEPLSFTCAEGDGDGRALEQLEPASAEVQCQTDGAVIRGSGAERIDGTISTELEVIELDEEIEYVQMSGSYGEISGDECPIGLLDLE
jgi:hypothetical protein